MTREEAISLLPRFMNAVTTMANATDKTQRLRLARIISDVIVFSDEEIPDDISAQYKEFTSLISEPELPPYVENHPCWLKSVKAAYLSPQKAKRATKLLTTMFEEIAWQAVDSEEA